MKMIVAVAMLCLLLAPVVVAQPKPMLRVDVPFEFYMANTVYPQGTYYIQSTNNGMSAMVSPVDVKVNPGFSPVISMSVPKKNAEKCYIVFRRVDADHVFLKQIWHGERQVGWELPMARTERDHLTVKFTAANQPQTLTILAQAR